MRKSIFIILAASLLSAACAKHETDSPDPIQEPVQEQEFPVTSLTARIDNGDTKTGYTIDEEHMKAYFAWTADDQIDGIIRMGSGASAYHTGVRFAAQGAGTETEFMDGQVSGDRTVAELLSQDSNAELSDWAIYPSRDNEAPLLGGYRLDWSVKDGKLTLDLPSSLTPPIGNPLMIVPLMGCKNGSGVYEFTPMTAVLAVPVNNLPDDANFISVTSADAALAGNFTFDLGGVVTQNNVGTKDPAGMTLHFSGLSGNQTFYFPLPSGTIPAGLTLTVGNDASEDNRMVVTTKKALTLMNGQITRTPALNFTPVDQQWADYIDGTFIDEFVWSQRGWSTSTRIPVMIQRSGLHPTKYRIANPYTTAISTFNNYTRPANIATDDYFVFHIDDENNVSFNAFNPGVQDANDNVLTMNYRPAKAQYTYVKKAATDGTPLELQLGVYYTIPGDQYQKDDKETNDKIRIVLNHPVTWTKVADGTFIDEKMWNLHEWGTTSVPIELEQSDLSETDFRVANPYLIAKDQFGYSTYTSGISGDSYLVFSIQSGDAVRFTTFLAGIEDINSGGKPMKVWYPLDWGSSYTTDAAKNIVTSYRSDGLPAEVELYAIYSDPNNVNHKYTNQGTDRLRMSFPVEETWLDAGTVRYLDTFIWHRSNNFTAGEYVEVALQKSSTVSGKYRIANPYLAAATHFSYTIPSGISAGDEYMYFYVDSENKVTFDSFNTGINLDSNKSLTITHLTEWRTYNSSSTVGSVDDNLVLFANADGTPARIKIEPFYHQTGNYKEATTSNGGYYYPPVDTQNNHRYIYIDFNGPETWASMGTGRFWDKLVWSCAGITEYAQVEFQQNSYNANLFRIAKPYPGTNSDPWFVFDVTDPDKVTSDNYFVDYEVTASGKAVFKPWIRNGAYNYTYSKVLLTQTNGLPSVVQIGPCYRGDEFANYTTNEKFNYEIGRDQSSNQPAIEIVFPGCETYAYQIAEKLVVSHYGSNFLKESFHNPIAKLTMPNGTLERLVVKISGIDLSIVTGLRLYQGGWMESGYVAPDANGIVTMTSFTNATVSSNIDLNCWLTSTPIGSGVHFEVLEAVVSGVSLPIVQEDVVHLARLTLNNGGDNVTVRYNTAETVASFRIPAFVTSNAGTLIAAYDVRYADNKDLQGDIDVGMKRSTDGGKTWSDLKLIMDMGITGYESEIAAGTMTNADAESLNGIGDPCLLVDENTGRIFCFAAWAHGHPWSGYGTALSWAGTGYDYNTTTQFMMVYSDDDGVTWSEPINITRQIKQPDWKMTFQGPGRGITMADGTLVIPIQHQEGNVMAHGKTALYAGIMYSTDHGYTWHTHNYAYPITSESAVAEIEPGKLLLTMRDETDSRVRRNYYTTDLGRTWQKHVSDGQLIEPTCEASLIHVNASDNVLGKDLLIFSNPHYNVDTSRIRMTIQISEDQGTTWPYSLLLDSGGTQYSCLTMIDNATVGIIYEKSTTGPIVFQAIPLTDIVK